MRVAMRAACLIVVVVIGGATARADTTVLRFSQSTSLPRSWKELPDNIASSIAAVIGARTSAESLVTLRCAETDACLDEAARSLDATELVFGTIRPGTARDNKVVTITRFAPGRSRVDQSYLIVLTRSDPARELAREALPFLQEPLPGDRESPHSADRESPRSADRESPRSADRESPFSADREDAKARDRTPARDSAAAPTRASRRRSRGTYVLVASGGASLALGIGFMWEAFVTRDEVAAAPVETSQDLRRLAALERRGQMFVTTGAALSVAGGTLIGIAIYRAVRERRATITTTLALAPTRDGAALVYTRSWR